MSSHSLTALYVLLHSPWAGRLGWTLIHSLWEGGLLALAFAALSRRPGTTADTRYLGACAALLLMAACPAMTWLMLRAPAGTGAGLPAGATAAGPWDSLPGWAALAWMAGVGVLSVRVLGGWVRVERLRRQTTPLPDEVHRRVKLLARRMGVTRRLYVRASPAVQVPTVIGWLRRVVLVPTGLVSGLPPAALDALLAHEFAHVRRHDYLVNFIQTLLETLLFYHPAAWWVSHQIRVEREHCCDDLAAALVGDRVLYARALTALEETRQGTLVLAASDGDLLTRVRRLVCAPTGDVPLPLSTAGLPLVFGLWMAALVWPVSLWSLMPPSAPQKRDVTAASVRPAPTVPASITSPARPHPRPNPVHVAVVAHRSSMAAARVCVRGSVRPPLRPRSPALRRVVLWRRSLVLNPVRVLPAVFIVSAPPAAPDGDSEQTPQPEQPSATVVTAQAAASEPAPEPAFAAAIRYKQGARPVMIHLAGYAVQSVPPAGVPSTSAADASDDPSSDGRGLPGAESAPPVKAPVPEDVAPPKGIPSPDKAPERIFPGDAVVERMRALQDRMIRLQVQMQALAEQMRALQGQLQEQMLQGQWPQPKRPSAGRALPGGTWTTPSGPPAAAPAPVAPSEDVLVQ